MKQVFIDTSFLVKLFMTEEDSAGARATVAEFGGRGQIIVSSVTSLEFQSAVGRKVRSGKIFEDAGQQILATFKANKSLFEVVPFVSVTLLASTLMDMYWKQGLRTLDSIQLASMVAMRTQTVGVACSDLLLRKLIQAQGLKLIG
jgi:predicted nucleic acid-binding protein